MGILVGSQEVIVELAQSPDLRNHFVTNGLAFVHSCDWETNKVEYLTFVDTTYRQTTSIASAGVSCKPVLRLGICRL